MNVNQWGAVNQWVSGGEPIIIEASLANTLSSGFAASVFFPVNVNASVAATATYANNATVTVNGQPFTVNASKAETLTNSLPALVTITPGPSEPIIINASIGSSYSDGYRANVTIGTVTIRIYSGTHYEIPNY